MIGRWVNVWVPSEPLDNVPLICKRCSPARRGGPKKKRYNESSRRLQGMDDHEDGDGPDDGDGHDDGDDGNERFDKSAKSVSPL